MSEITVPASGHPDEDFTKIQEAVRGYDVVRLQGIFNLTGKETGTDTSRHVIEINRSVSIVGELLSAIVGGERPFYIVAPGANVLIDNLTFQNSLAAAIAVIDAAELVVSGCKFQGVVPVAQKIQEVTLNVATAIGAGGAKVKISIVGNRMDIGGTSNDSTNGILIGNSMAGTIEISGNTIENTTAHGIDVRSPANQATIVGNTLRSGMNGRSGGPGNFADGIRCHGSGNFTVEGNTIEYSSLNGAGIRLAGTSGAVVQQNTINMALPTGTPGKWSAGIQVQGTGTGNKVLRNTVLGRARVALAAIYSNEPANTPGKPTNTTFERNDHAGFTETFADVEVGEGASDTLLIAATVAVGKGELNAADESAELAMSASVGGTSSTEDIRAEPAGTLYDAGIRTVVKGVYTRLPLMA